ncbi:centriolin isoform x1 [Limosa lapponica baueri]|uniref:Centriolin isoform x1 n=1 Tax=Limosa lapponica baueri TaxID=1758121 RepID=A0A2I0TUF8_LIMLA|nr:centriolin isoform x1 [Limosa lapponica baueri]
MSPVSSNTRSPSPLSQQTSPSPCKSTERRHQQPDITAENVEAAFEYKFHKDENGVSAGVRYITESLIKGLSKQENLAFISSLNLSSTKDGDKKFKYIENLEKCSKLETLNLSNNQIEKIEKLDKLMRLRELNLSCNKIRRGSRIDSIRQALHDIAKLKPLQDLTSLFLAGNPVVSLPHYRLYTIFHLRALENLDGRPVTNHDRQEALERFNLEEIEKLERELEKTVKEMENLKLNQSKVLEQLRHQDEVNKALKEKTLQQKQSYENLQRDLGTKNELLKQKTAELTRACQKQYELEQELAFYKIDAKFEPLNYFPPEELFVVEHKNDVELDNVPGESPYIAQRRLEELQSAIANAEQQVLKVTGELQQLEDALAQKKISQANREGLEQQLSEKIQLLHRLRQEALELENQMEKQKREIGKKQKELEDLQSSLASVNPEDPRHAHMKAQRASKEQQFDVMNKHYKQLESRLDEMLSRIAKETEEIKDLEQQLTDGQIATNEALKRDLESIITGLQEYLESVKCQAKQANDECKELQKDKESLLQRLADLEKERNNLEIVAMDAENMRQEIKMLEGALQEQREINESLRDAQGDISAYEAELEAQLRDRDTEANQQKEELERLKQLSQMELSALQAELEKERQALENALTKAQLAEEKEQQNCKLLSQFKQLQGDNNLLKQQLKDLQNQLNHAVGNLIHPEEVLARINELKQKLQMGVGEIKCQNSADVLGKSLANLQKEFNDILADAQREKEKAWARQRQLQEEMGSQQEKLEEVKAENRQNKNKVHQLQNEIQHLHEKIKSMEEIQGLADQQLQEADEEKETILAQLEDLEKKKKIEDARAQMQFVSLDKELKELKRAIITSDKLAATELSIAKNQLKALHGTVLRINQERAEMTAQQQELLFLEQQLNQRREELRVLQDCISQKKGDLKEALRDGETEANEKLRQIRIIYRYFKLLIENLSPNIFVEKKEELETLKGELNDSRQQLQLVEQDLKNNTRRQDELLREQAALKEDILQYLRKRKDCHERQKKRENQLQQLQKEMEEKETELAKQEAVTSSSSFLLQYFCAKPIGCS